MSGNSSQITDPTKVFAAPLPSAPEKVEGRLHSVALRVFIIIAAGVLACGGAVAISYITGMVVIPALVIIGVGALLIGSLIAWTVLDGCFPQESITVAPSAGKPSPQNSQQQLPPPPSGGSSLLGGTSGKPPPGSGPPPSGKVSGRPPGRPPRRPPPDIFEAFPHSWEQVGLGPFNMTSTQLKKEIADWIRENYQADDQLTALLNEDKATKFGKKTKRTIEDYLTAAESENIVGLAHLYALGNLHHVRIITPGRCLYEPQKATAACHIDIQSNCPILERFTKIMPSTIQGILGRVEELLAQGNPAKIDELLNCDAIAEFKALSHLEHHADIIDRIERLRELRERCSSNIFEGILHAWETTGLPPLGMTAAQLKGGVDRWIRENYQENDKLQELLREDMGAAQYPEGPFEDYLEVAESGNIVGLAHLYALGYLFHVRIIINNCSCLYEPQNSMAVCYLNTRNNPIASDRFHDIRPSTVQEILEKAEALFETDDDDHLPEIKELLYRQEVTEFTGLPVNDHNRAIAREIRELRGLYSKRTLAQYGLWIS